MSQDDLQDVIPIGVTVTISDGVQEMKFGKRICEIRGYGENGWTTDQMLDYFTDLCRVYDAWAESRKPWVMPESYEDLRLPDGIRWQGYNTWHELRDFVAKVYDHFVPHSMADVLRQLGVPIENWQMSVCGGGRVNIPRIMTVQELGEIEQFYTAITPPYEIKELIERTGFSRGTLGTIGKQFAKRRIAIHGENALKVDRAPAMLKHLVAEGRHTNSECLRMVHQATGVKFSKSYVSKIRQRQEPE